MKTMEIVMTKMKVKLAQEKKPEKTKLKKLVKTPNGHKKI